MARGKRHLPPSKQKKRTNATANAPAKMETEESKEKNLFDLLSPTLQHNIFRRLKPRELCVCQSVCRSWKKIMSSNELWWPHAMRLFWTPEERPKTIEKRELKKNPGKWKEEYKQAFLKQQLRPPPMKKERLSPEWQETPMTKQEMREHYKAIRSNPKGKKPTRDRNAKLYAMDYDGDIFN